MGSLIALPEFRRTYASGRGDYPNADSFWYFADTERHHQSDFKVETTFPHTVYIHADWIVGARYFYEGETFGRSKQNAGQYRVAMRQWIEDNIPGPVIYEFLDKNYFRAHLPVYNAEKQRETRGWEQDISHGYYAFYFDTLASATLFRLSYSDITQLETSQRHPSFPRQEGTVDVRQSYSAHHAASGLASPEELERLEIEF